LHADAVTMHVALPGYRRELGYERIRRAALPALDPAERLAEPEASVERVLEEDAARREASRCLDCGVTPIFDGTRCVLCGGCADVCPTACLKLVPLEDVTLALPEVAFPAPVTVILKDEERCIRCALCAQRCPSDAIAMERWIAATTWRSVP
jgi:ferredoxin